MNQSDNGAPYIKEYSSRHDKDSVLLKADSNGNSGSSGGRSNVNRSGGNDSSLRSSVNRNGSQPLVAYFCMEYGLAANFRIYSGGLGILAGDLIKAAYDENYPMVAIGILWRQGYTSQTIDEHGRPVDSFHEYRYPFLKDTGVKVSVIIKKAPIRCKVWLCDCFGNVPLYLLDAFLPENQNSLITGQLYGWFDEERLAQEIILGIGGVRALAALGIQPDIYHFNEGHAVLAGLELIKNEIKRTRCSVAPIADTKGNGQFNELFQGDSQQEDLQQVYSQQEDSRQANSHQWDSRQANSCQEESRQEDSQQDKKMFKYSASEFVTAWETVRGKIVFTTHTPVLAGNETHSIESMRYIGADNGFRKHDLALLAGNPFNMTVAGLRLSKAANAVSDLHAATASAMWSDVVDKFHGILSITNGVHNGTWQNPDIINACNSMSSANASPANENILWETHMKLKEQLIREIERRNNITLCSDKLFIGFGRRAATYKRSDLIFSDQELYTQLFESGNVCLIFSGKAHPNDPAGKIIVSSLYEMSLKYPDNVVFLQNYDIEIGKLMTSGCDVWLNNPIRPLEACGTSGMKAAMNGVLNLSVLDGWWLESCEHGVNGWQIGDGYEGYDHAKIDSQSLYKTLFEEVIPTFHEDRRKWIHMMKNSIEMSQHRFSAARMLGDYITKIYNNDGAHDY